MIGGEQACGLAFIRLSDERDTAVGRKSVDAAILVGGEQDLALQREHVVHVLFLGRPERLDGVVGIDAIEGRLLDAAHIDNGVELRADLGSRGHRGRLHGLRIGRLDLVAGAGLRFDGDGGGGGGHAAAALAL